MQSWRYGPNDQARVFEDGETVPTGWADHPSKVKKDALDHDGDGKKGGSEKGSASTAAKGAKRKAVKRDDSK